MAPGVAVEDTGGGADPAAAPWDQLLARPSTAELQVWDGAAFQRTSWSERVASAEGVAAHLRHEYGVTNGVPVGCVLENSVEAIDAVLGIWLAGGIVLSLPSRARGMARKEHAKQLGDLTVHAEATLVLLPQRDVEHLSPELAVTCTGYPSLRASGRCADPPAATETCFVQYSSGVTAEPKGCALTPTAIADQLTALGETLRLSSGDRFASWLPLGHDMGFFGTFMLPWWHGLPACVSSPGRFAASPRSWLEDCAASRATITAAPNFALDVAARSAAKQRLGKPLQLRSLVIGAEPVEWQSMSRFVAAFSESGLTFERLTPAYGLAEATLAVTVGSPDRVAVLATAPRESGGDGAAPYVGLGTPIRGTAIRIEGGEVGEVLVSSSSAASGYFNAPELTARRFVDGMIRTGDLGFLRDGELHIVGRADDMLAVAGRNVFAPELEASVAERLGIAGARVAVVATRNRSRRLVVLVEHTPESAAAARSLASAADEAAIARAGIGINRCVFLRPRTMPRSASGKLQRPRAEMLASGRSAENVAATVTVRSG